jgi:hypothetical protein
MVSQPSPHERWLKMPQDASRDEYFWTVREAIRKHYLAEPSNPYRQSGRNSGASRWEETRRCILRALHHSGDFMDVGCANGLLLETLIEWAKQAGFVLRPHGVDFVPELIALAQERFPHEAANFQVDNAFYWRPGRRYDFVRTNIEYVPRADWVDFVHDQYGAVACGGRLIVCHYRNRDDPYVELGPIIERAGHAVAGMLDVRGASIAWIEGPVDKS